MTCPANNVSLKTHVRDLFIRDGGNISLKSERVRDGAQQGTGSVRLSQFANKGWAAGRVQQIEGSTSTVKPYYVHCGVDGWSWQNGNITVEYANNLPRWRLKESWTNMMTNQSAFYANTWFYCNRPGLRHTFYCDSIISKWHNGYGSYVAYDFSARGWSAGYQSGNVQIWQDWNNVRSSNGGRSFTFTPSASYPYVQLALRILSRGYQGWDGAVPAIDVTAYNMRCYI